MRDNHCEKYYKIVERDLVREFRKFLKLLVKGCFVKLIQSDKDVKIFRMIHNKEKKRAKCKNVEQILNFFMFVNKY